ncbi:ABC transporter permease [Filobacillus milosensis]|uniref:ABC transporter permease n=1 Tax=Filobacillus milosensis TaxID=94137 RepID=A0A4Y8ILH5_9BACI|nr:ABC transporter permease [Filobacillus milosensis]TFB22141.1 ABC transporter permease [Filobacillus milosensis]
MIVLKALLKQRITFILLLLIPILLGLIWVNYFQDTVDDLKVPVVLVDPYNQTITDELLSEIEVDDTFNLTRTSEIPLKALERGEVEAIFVLPENLKELIMWSDLEGQIKWYRNDRSLFDGLFKEQLASSIMTRAVRAEAANVVQNYDSEENWEEMFEFGLRYFEPEPIFQMNFQQISSDMSENDSSDQYYLMRWLTWLYLMIVSSFFTKMMLEWKEQHISGRLKVISKTNSLRTSWLLLTGLIIGTLGLILVISIQWVFLSQVYLLSLLVDIGIILVSVFGYLLLTFIINKKETLWALTLGYGMTSSVVFFLLFFQILNHSWWTKLFLPSWILL